MTNRYLHFFFRIFLIISFTGQTANAVMVKDTIFITDFGAVPDSRLNATQAVVRAMEACTGKKDIVLFFPGGRYDFWPQHCIEKDYYESNTTDNNPKRLAVFINEKENLTIECGGSDFVFHDRMQPFTVDHSSNITIRNVSVDWDIPLTAQAEVTQVTDEYIDLRINITESPFIIEDSQVGYR